MCGRVASPTPTMPISSLSISVTETSGPSSFASALALIHPAVPPPSTTMRIVPLPLIARRSAGARRRRGPAFHLFQFLALRLLDEASDQEEADRSEEHTSELQSLMRISYAVFCLKKKKKQLT